MKISFEAKDFLASKYLNYSIESLAAEECKVHNVINGIFALSSNYSSYISSTLPILCQIDKFKSGKNKSGIEDARRAFLLHTINTINNIKDLEIEHPTIYNMMNDVYEFGDDEPNFIDIPAFTYKLSLRYIKNGLDKLLNHIKDMAMYRDLSVWKKYFSDIELDLRNIYNEIVGYEFMFAAALMGSKAIEKIDYMRSHGARGDKIKIKSIADIAKYSYDVIKTLGEFYNLAIETNYQMLVNASISDPNDYVKNSGGNVENVHKDIEADFTGFADEFNENDEVEDFINTDD